jgi:hypothetical protein
MIRSRYSIRLTAGSLLLASALTGCGTGPGIVVGSLVSSHERSEDDSFSTRQCSSFKDKEYLVCHEMCMSDQARKRFESKKRLEQESESPGGGSTQGPAEKYITEMNCRA